MPNNHGIIPDFVTSMTIFHERAIENGVYEKLARHRKCTPCDGI